MPTPRVFAVLVGFALLFLAVDGFASEGPGVFTLPAGGAVGRWPLEPGMNAPSFVLKDIDGSAFDLKMERVRSTVLLVFFSMFCEPCRRALTDAQRLHDRFGSAGLRVAAVSLDGEPLRNTVSGFVRQEGYGFRVLIDETGAQNQFRAADLFRVTEIPTAFLINSNGRILLIKKGAIPEEEVEKLLPAAVKQ